MLTREQSLIVSADLGSNHEFISEMTGNTGRLVDHRKECHGLAVRSHLVEEEFLGQHKLGW
jgi:hypothetical protein